MASCSEASARGEAANWQERYIGTGKGAKRTGTAEGRGGGGVGMRCQDLVDLAILIEDERGWWGMRRRWAGSVCGPRGQVAMDALILSWQEQARDLGRGRIGRQADVGPLSK